MDWNELESLNNDFFISKREDDFVISSLIDNIDSNSDQDNLGKMNARNKHHHGESDPKLLHTKMVNKSMESINKERTKAFELSLEKKKSQVLLFK